MIYVTFVFNLSIFIVVDHLEAVAVIKGVNNINGIIYFAQSYSAAAPVAVFGKVSNLPNGPHGLHVHQFGNLTDNCDSTGPDFNPDVVYHGGPDDLVRHVGDLGNLEGGQFAASGFTLTDNRLSLFGRNSIIGRSIVIHQNADDLGKGKSQSTLVEGNAGARIACGIIAWKSVVIDS